MRDEFKTIRAGGRAEHRVRGSRFIATAIPIRSREEAEDAVREIRNAFHDATHNCYAYRVGTTSHEFRFNDDGEPSGTGGRPILAAIDRIGLTDILVVVTRYFGGTKLGVAGLARAYGEAAAEVLKRADVLMRYTMATLDASFPHGQVGNVMKTISRVGARIVDTVYDEDVHMRLEVRTSLLDELRSLLVEHTSGNIHLRTPIDDSHPAG